MLFMEVQAVITQMNSNVPSVNISTNLPDSLQSEHPLECLEIKP